MSKTIAAFFLAAVIMLSFPAMALATAVSSTDLIEGAKDLNGREVVYAGEVIGDIMIRGDHAWVNISDGSNAIGVWLKAANMQGIAIPGRYGVHGDEVRLTGVFYRACPEHGGDMDIHARQAEILKKGFAVPGKVEPFNAAAAAVLMLGNVFLFAFMAKKRRSSRP